MTARSIEARIVKLENHSVRDGEYYLLWRLPGDEVGAAVAAAQLPRGTRIICPEWFGQLPPPRSRWVGANERRLPKHEEAGIYEAVDRLYSAKVGCATVHSQSTRREPDAAQYSLAEMTDVELDFAIFGVTVQ